MTDFGIATISPTDQDHRPGMVMGSQGFTAQERISGEERVDRLTCGRSARTSNAAG